MMSDEETSSEPEHETYHEPLGPVKDGYASVSASQDAVSELAAHLRPISPPQLKRKRTSVGVHQARPEPSLDCRLVPSPFQLTKVRDLPSASNVDAVLLKDILGDPLITECWQFNFLFNVDFFMAAFDPDIRQTVKVKVVHGSWKKEDTNRQGIEAAIFRYPNVQAITASMPEPFGSHHTKMMIMFRNDDSAQIVITTANMIPQDWANLTQAVWRSPMLSLQKDASSETNSDVNSPHGTGIRFKKDLLNYLTAYGHSRTGQLTAKLRKHDFYDVKAALVGSVPCKQPLGGSSAAQETLWGWQGLKQVLRMIPTAAEPKGRPTIVAQVSSIASLGQAEKWLTNLFEVPSTSTPSKPEQADYRIIFPTADEIKWSLDGYRAGGSIHTKVVTPAQEKQLEYLRPRLCHWAGDDATDETAGQSSRAVREAGRRRAAPHIKTYIRFSGPSFERIDWAMVTSANLSKQAWGELANKDGEVRICSWELGVVVWPDLFASSSQDKSTSIMVPTFQSDKPTHAIPGVENIVGMRMPYDLPLVPYQAGELPWCNSVVHSIPDWKGQVWPPMRD